jgi:hypothetical protein
MKANQDQVVESVNVEREVLIDRLRFIDYIMESLCGRELREGGREFLRKEVIKIKKRLENVAD